MTKRKQNPHAWARSSLAAWLKRWHAQAAEKIEAEARQAGDPLAAEKLLRDADELRRWAR